MSGITLDNSVEHGVVYFIDENRLHRDIKINDLFAGKKTVVFGGPAPFSNLDTQQAEQYQLASAELLSLGVDQVVGIYVQDAFVMQKFKEHIAEKTGIDNIGFYGDGDGFFAQANYLTHDFTFQGLSTRSIRWCAVLNDRKVEFVGTDDYQLISNTHVDKVLAWLKK
jgi:peroxiredoxin